MHTQRFAKFCAVVAACFCFIVVFTDEGSTREEEAEYNPAKDPRYQQSNKTQCQYKQRNKREKKQGSYFKEHGYKHLDIPKKDYPRLGECRIWYPKQHQSVRIECGEMPPFGTWLIQHPKNRPHHVQVEVYEPRRQDVLFTIGEFEIRTGAFVREIPSK